MEFHSYYAIDTVLEKQGLLRCTSRTKSKARRHMTSLAEILCSGEKMLHVQRIQF